MANNKRYKYTEEEFLKIVYALVGDEYTVLSEYKGNRNKVLMRHNVCGNEWWITPDNFVEKGSRCPIENATIKYTTETFKEKLLAVNPNLELLDEYINGKTKVRFKCLKDGFIFSAQPQQVLSGTGCPCCAGRKVVVGINDLNTTHPNITNYLINYDDGYTITYGSHKKLTFQCPCCKSLKKCRPNMVMDSNNKYKCIVCGDGLSYPEKFTLSLLEQLDVEYIYQLTQKYFDWIGNYRYDFYIPSKDLIIEVNGLQHYDININRLWNIKSDVDLKKYNLAINNGIKNFVYVDARYSKFDYIKENLIQSLSDYFDLSFVDWNLCGRNANDSLMIKVCHYIETHENYDMQELEKQFNLNESTIRRYVKEGDCLGLCSLKRYEYFVHKCKNDKISEAVSNDIICIETGEIFKSISFVNKTYKNIRLVGIKNKPKQFGLTWEYYAKDKLYPNPYNFTLNDYIKRYYELLSLTSKINQYDENFNYICTYDNFKELSTKGYSVGSISKYMTQRALSYASYWYYSFDVSQPSKQHIQKIIPTEMDWFIIKGSFKRELYNDMLKEAS